MCEIVSNPTLSLHHVIVHQFCCLLVYLLYVMYLCPCFWTHIHLLTLKFYLVSQHNDQTFIYTPLKEQPMIENNNIININ